MKQIDVDEVTQTHRQQAKQVVYGMLYGIGSKSLGEQLGVTSEEADVFVEAFMSRYTGEYCQGCHINYSTFLPNPCI